MKQNFAACVWVKAPCWESDIHFANSVLGPGLNILKKNNNNNPESGVFLFCAAQYSVSIVRKCSETVLENLDFI